MLTLTIVLQVLSGILTPLAVLDVAVPGAAVWFGLAFNLVFALAFGYFGFTRPETSLTPELQS